MKKLFLSLLLFAQFLASKNLIGSEKISLIREFSNSTMEITRLINENLSQNEAENFYNELSQALTMERANSIVVSHLGSANSTLFISFADKMVNTAVKINTLGITREEFDEILQKANLPNDDEYQGGACRSWTAYRQCADACNGASAWGSHMWTILSNIGGSAMAGAGWGAWLAEFTAGASAGAGALIGGLYGLYTGFDEVGKKYGDCITKCYDVHCRGIDTNIEGTGGGLPGGGWYKEDKTAK
jgi:hypothetical protein